MKIYTATFTRDGKRWLVQVAEVPGCQTQALSIEQGLSRISEALALYDSRKFEVTPDVKLQPSARRALNSWRKRLHAEEESHRLAVEAQQTVVRTLLTEMALTNRDAGRLMNLSHQRVNQLLPKKKKSILWSSV